ncbi:MAG: AAA family ATPase, partial [Salinisphaera sp.]|nr:AAA family ATPase [Salinisphaera sp.]
AGLVLGKDPQIRLAMACLLARGHLLIEDLPGVGKTTLARSLAAVLGLAFGRVQFTSDLLPADILGVSVFSPAEGAFEFHPGPIFSQLLLADEINRANPKTQSALLEAMEETQVTSDGATRALPEPFVVVATQNPNDQAGTFPLPESQLDRFLMAVRLGYPPPASERRLLAARSRRAALQEVRAAMDSRELIALQGECERVLVSDALLDYILALVSCSRESGAFVQGLSPRAGLALRRAAQGWALLSQRNHVLPEDVQAILSAVVDHRLVPVQPGPQGPGALLRSAVAIP